MQTYSCRFFCLRFNEPKSDSSFTGCGLISEGQTELRHSRDTVGQTTDSQVKLRLHTDAQQKQDSASTEKITRGGTSARSAFFQLMLAKANLSMLASVFLSSKMTIKSTLRFMQQGRLTLAWGSLALQQVSQHVWLMSQTIRKPDHRS